MKVLIITETLETNSGWGRYSHEIVKGLRNSGNEVDVFIAKGKSAFGFFRNIFKIRQKIRNHDLVHALDGWPYSVYGYLAILGSHKKLFITGIGTYSVPQGSWLKKYLLKRAYLRASKIFAISNYTARQISTAVSEARIDVVHLGLTSLSHLYAQEREEIEKRFSLPKYKPLILSVGEIKNRKGQYDTLRSLPSLLSICPEAGYVMVGKSKDVKYRNKIDEFVALNGLEGKVKIISSVKEDKELAYLYSSCDVLALNSRNEDGHFEGFGLVILEAAQFGKPSVGSYGCGIEDAIKNNETGILVPQGDIDGIKDGILRSLNMDSQKIREFSKQFSWERTVSSYEKSYQEGD